MGIRTPGLVIANDALYQLSYTPGLADLKLNISEFYWQGMIALLPFHVKMEQFRLWRGEVTSI
jgi:hypothetical protein